jgi:LmbE family N-acetylglucosaminyl deacetylase
MNMKEENKRVLAIGAHPDDIEFMCSGTLKLLKDRGYEISIGVVANGDCGSMYELPENITRIRRQEALEAAAKLDAKFYPLGELDLRIAYDDRNCMKVTELVREVDPFLVFTHPHEDYMIDHETTSRLVRTACFNASVPNYFTYSVTPQPRTSRIPHLFYWGPLEGKTMYGDFVEQRIYVNVSTVVDFKAEMLAQHASQRDWLVEQHGMDKYLETMRDTARKYGKRCGFPYAEGFMQHLGNAYPQNNILAEILGDYVKEKM